MVSLNFEIGGDIARNLFNIYEYINYTMAQCNINKNDHNLEFNYRDVDGFKRNLERSNSDQ